MSQETRPTRLSVIGQGKLGCPIAAALATRGFVVTGVDSDRERVDKINRKEAPIYEPGLAELLQEAGDHYHATTDLHAAILETDATLIIVPTPSQSDGSFSHDAVLAVCRGIGAALAQKRAYHLVVVTSTVMPGATGGEIRRCLEQASGLTMGRDFGLCYSPEFVALGSVIKDFLHPDMLLIGQCDERAGAMLEAIGAAAALTKPSVARMSFVNAELAKIAVNTFVTTKITFANMLAQLCQHLPGADVDQVTRALGLDSRIGAKYLRGAVGYGGPCFPRDNQALAAAARAVEAQADLAQAVDAANRAGVQRLADLVRAHRGDYGTVGVLGLAYKPHTDVIEEAQGMMLAREMHHRSWPVVAFDPAAGAAARAVLPAGITVANSLEQVVAQADVLVITTPWPQFKELETLLAAPAPASPAPGNPAPGPGSLSLSAQGQMAHGRVIIDGWRMLDPRKLAAVDPTLTYVGLGRGPAPVAAPAVAATMQEAAA